MISSSAVTREALLFLSVLLWIGQLSSHGKEVPLDICQYSLEFVVLQKRSRGTDERVQFVDVSVRSHPGIILANLRPIKQPRVSFVSGLRVDFHRN